LTEKIKKYLKIGKEGKKPGILGRRKVLLIFIAVLFVEFLFLSNSLGRISFQDLLAKIAPSELVMLTNVRRQERGLDELTTDPRLVGAAQLKAEHMAQNGYFAHTSPDGIKPWHWFDEAGYDYQYAGENLAVNFREPEQIDQAWMDSPTHRDNIISEKFEDIGIATARGEYNGGEATYVVQLFGTRRQEYVEPVRETEREILAQNEETNESVLGEEVESDQEINEEEKEEILPEEPKEDSDEEVENETESVIEGVPIEESFAFMEKEDERVVLAVGIPEESIRSLEGDHRYTSFWGRATSEPVKSLGYLLTIIASIFTFSLVIKSIMNAKIHIPHVVLNSLLIILIIASALLTQHYVLYLAGLAI